MFSLEVGDSGEQICATLNLIYGTAKRILQEKRRENVQRLRLCKQLVFCLVCYFKSYLRNCEAHFAREAQRKCREVASMQATGFLLGIGCFGGARGDAIL
jgi:hypothetical protein